VLEGDMEREKKYGHNTQNNVFPMSTKITQKRRSPKCIMTNLEN
jgi:hypothetical protein